jgi:hypothetical protein
MKDYARDTVENASALYQKVKDDFDIYKYFLFLLVTNPPSFPRLPSAVILE